MKTNLALALMLVSAQFAHAQETNILHQNVSRSNISVSGGVFFSQNNVLKNGFNAQVDAFLPFYQNEGVKGDGFALGINIGGNYVGVTNVAQDNNAVAYRYQVYSATNAVSTNKNGGNSNSFSGLLGIQAVFGIGQFYISPIVNTGYSKFTLKGFTQTGVYSINGQSQSIDLVKREKKSSSGMLFKPQLKIGYNLSPLISVFASSAYVMGPSLKYTTDNWVPQGGINPQNMYEVKQMLAGSWLATSGSDKYKAIEINIGVSVTIGKSNGKYGRKKGATGLQAGANAASQGASRVAGDRGNSEGTTIDNFDGSSASRKGINEKEMKRVEVTALAAPGSPIDGIVVKGGKNPGGNNINLVTDDNGEIIFNAIEAGEYKIRFTTSGSSAVAKRTGRRTYTGGRKNEVPTSNMTAGSPIGGIVVKGGKNPSPGNGWGAISVISDDNGTATFNVVEAGQYKLRLTAPETEENGLINPESKK